MCLPPSLCLFRGVLCRFSFFFFFNDTATTEIYTLSLHDALPISFGRQPEAASPDSFRPRSRATSAAAAWTAASRRFASRSEEHTSELQSPCNLVCRLLLEKKKTYELISSYAVKWLTILMLRSKDN